MRRHETFEPRLVSSAGEVGLGATLALLAIGHPWNVVDERDPSTYRHSLRVAGYVDGLARLATSLLRDRPSPLGRPPARSRQGRRRRVAPAQARRARRAEWAAMRRHPRLSARLLQRFEFVSAQLRAVELHHERMDGAEYYGVGGDDLPLASHFLIVADSFDAMTTDRPYRAGLSHDAALTEIERNAGAQFTHRGPSLRRGAAWQ